MRKSKLKYWSSVKQIKNDKVEKNIENNEEVNPKCDDFISKKFTNIVSSTNNPKKIISKEAKLSFILHLKKAMKTMIIIFRQMQKDEFVSKFNFDFSKQFLSPYRYLKNDQYIEDEHQNAIDNYLFKQPQEIHESMVKAYGEESFLLSFVKKWKVMFDNGRTSIEDTERTVRPFIKENVERVSEYINDYPFSSARSIASALDIDKKQLLKY